MNYDYLYYNQWFKTPLVSDAQVCSGHTCKVKLNHLTRVLRVFLTFYGSEKKDNERYVKYLGTLSILGPLSKPDKQTTSTAVIFDCKILFIF